MAYMIYRLAMYLVLSLVLVFAILAGTGTGLILDSFATNSSFFSGIGGIAGFAIFGFVFYWFRDTWLYSMKAPHVALLNEAIEERIVQQGRAQVAHAQNRVSERFSSAANLYTLDKRTKAVLAHLFRRCNAIGQRLSGLGDTIFSRLIARIAETSASYVHETILAECLKDTTRSASSVATAALVLYAQNFDRLFKNALALLALKYFAATVIYLLMLAPVGWIDEIIPVELGGWAYVLALLLTWPIKSALFDPIALAAMLGVFQDLTRGQSPDSDWEVRLASESPEFASIKKQAEFLEATSDNTNTSGEARN
ncbi:MAG: hypothetical protein L0Y43_01210 [Methylococcaceae bacterium]|nr:hypothetical protein [Methylococcaceae bacterium]